MSDSKTNPVEFNAWKHAIHRCYNDNDGSYYNYGNRGIKMSTEWLADFNNFLQDMGERPGTGYSLDRIDVNGHYTAANCRWADAKTQANNKRAVQRRKPKTSYTFTHNGQTLKASEWSQITGIPASTIIDRKKRGWDDARCVNPVKGCYGKKNPKSKPLFLKTIQAAARQELENK